jgi:O-antigen/teichoic acid export membrane protein
MKSTIRLLASDSLVYGMGSALNGLAGFVLLPVLIKALYAQEYGRYALAEMFLNLLLVVLGLGQTMVLPGQYLATPEDQREGLVGGVLATALMLGIGFALMFVAAMTLMGGRLAPELPIRFYWLIAMIAVLEVLWGICATLLRIQNQPWRFIAVSVVQFVGSLATTVALIKFWRGREESILYGRLFADSLLLLFLLPGVWGSLFQVSWRRGWRMARLGLPLVPAMLATVWVAMSPRFFLEQFTDARVIGIYAMSTKVSGLTSLFFLQPFAMAWSVMLFKVQYEPSPQRIYARILTYYWVVGLTLALSIGVSAPYIASLLHGERFPLSGTVILLTALATIVSGLMYPVNVGIYLLNRTSQVLPIFLTSAVSVLVVGSVMASLWGGEGAALSLLVVYVLQVFMLGRLNARLYPIAWEWARIVKGTVALLAAYFLVRQIHLAHGMWAVGVMPLVFCLVAAGALGLSGFFDVAEIGILRAAMRRAAA